MDHFLAHVLGSSMQELYTGYQKMGQKMVHILVLNSFLFVLRILRLLLCYSGVNGFGKLP